ncbi:hypothetical protein VTJ83DRAFT_5678 [Remersonia thermophila]|uniref:Microsomal glutathione S-transferase 3 n=1 Tax=Remersonia thermophila TaxID=72144 RepID=A0ABR4D7M6_9PEZI
MSAITLPNEYGYVLAAATSTFFINSLHFFLTGSARKAAKIAYPRSYATEEEAAKDPKAFAFNCAQRAHANFTENLTPFLGALLVAGLKYPVFAASLGGIWSTARVIFALGYTSKGPQGRLLGSSVGILTDLVLKFTAAYASVGFVLGW